MILWYRRLTHSAHAFPGECPLLPIVAVRYPSDEPLRPVAPEGLSRHGIPYGGVCQWCLRRVRRLERAADREIVRQLVPRETVPLWRRAQAARS